MSKPLTPDLYKAVIDRLVEECRRGQGQLAPQRVRQGLWNENASAQHLPDQYEINRLLARMSQADRETLARMLSDQAELGVFEALKALEEFGISPFESGYEGSPYHDFVGRLKGWEWPRD